MGAAQSGSARSVSMDNPGVVDISDDVVNRLKSGITKQAREKSAKEQSSTKSTPSPPPKQQPRKAPTKPVAPPASGASVVYPNPTPLYVQAGHTITAADVRRQMETELQNNDALWRQRMTQLEENLKKTNTILETEYANAVEDVRKHFATTTATSRAPSCQGLKSQLLACYRAHPSETLRCTQEVTDFQNCVDYQRIQKLDADEEQQKSAAPKTTAAKVAAKAG